MSVHPVVHGTNAGFTQHLKAGQEPCDPCLTARATYQAWYRFRTGALHDPRRCRECGSVFPGHTCHALRAAS